MALLRRRDYLLDCLLQFLHIDWFRQMRGKTGPATALQIFLHPITTDRYALGVTDFGQFLHHLKAIPIRKTNVALRPRSIPQPLLLIYKTTRSGGPSYERTATSPYSGVNL